MSVTDDKEFEELIGHPDFMALSEPAQMQMVDEFKQKRRMITPKSENFLQNAIKGVFGTTNPMERMQTMSISGIPSAVAGVTPENAIGGQIEALPIEGQIMGGSLGGYPGAVAGETVGDIVSQGLNQLTGRGKFDLKNIGMNTAITAGTEGLGRGLGKLFMGKAASREAVKKGVSELSGMKETIKQAGVQNPNLGIPKQPIIDLLNTEFSKSLNPSGPAKRIFLNWKRILSDPNLTHISPDALMQMEQQFGQVAGFQTKGAFLEKLLYKLQSGVRDPILEGGAKNVRGAVSKEVNAVAKKAGVEGFEDASKKFSEAKYDVADNRNWLEKMLHTTMKYGEVPLAAQTAKLVGLPGSVGAGLGIIDLIRRSPMAQDFLYNAVGKSGIGRGATLGISDLMRRTEK